MLLEGSTPPVSPFGTEVHSADILRDRSILLLHFTCREDMRQSLARFSHNGLTVEIDKDHLNNRAALGCAGGCAGFLFADVHLLEHYHIVRVLGSGQKRAHRLLRYAAIDLFSPCILESVRACVHALEDCTGFRYELRSI